MLNQFFGEENAKKISKLVVLSLSVFSLFLLIKVITDLKRLPGVGREVYPQSTIMVSGEGEAYAIPDIATFSFTVTEAGESVEAAQGLLDGKIAKALAVVKDGGIEDKDVKTTGYNVYPKYEWNQMPCPMTSGVYYPCQGGKNELVGYEVSQSITVKVRDVKKAGDLVSKVGAVKVSNISGVEFTVDDREHFVAEAREQAINEAKAKAKVLAKELGVRLGKILYYNEGGNYPMYYGEATGMGGKDMAVAPQAVRSTAALPTGETKITSQISITYEIK